MKIRIINKSSNPLPEYKTAGAAGMDIRSNNQEPVTLHSLERAVIPTGLFVEIPQGYEGQIRPRSGLAAKKGITMLNSPGTIDADYRGEIGVIVVNLSQEAVTIEPGERIAQLVISRHERADWEEAVALEETDRGSGGFGSTGTR